MAIFIARCNLWYKIVHVMKYFHSLTLHQKIIILFFSQVNGKKENLPMTVHHIISIQSISKKTFLSPTPNSLAILQKNNFQHTKETLYDATNEKWATQNSKFLCRTKRWVSYINFLSDHYHTICFNLLLWNI